MDHLGHIYVAKIYSDIEREEKGCLFWTNIIYIGKRKQGIFMHVIVLIIKLVKD